MLNTKHALRSVLHEEKKRETENAPCVTACCFSQTQQTRCFFGFHDGLICFWVYSQDQQKVPSKLQKSLLGHTNKINHLTFEGGYLFSSAQDCTVRQWNVDKETCCRIFKFADPCSFATVHTQHNLLFTGSWDKQVRAIDLKNGEIDRAFVASKEAIRCLHLYDKWLFVAGCDPCIRAYDLTNGNIKTFEGHRSWVLCMQVLQLKREDGTVRDEWLFSGSDDNTIRVWSLKTCKCLDELNGHTNGVLSLAFADNNLFSGSYDQYLIMWDLNEIEHKINELQRMQFEDLRSKKFEAFEAYMESKGKRKKAPKKKGKKGKK